ncbi:magnesium-transporting ATPase (P-type) [Nocardiopsis composta]|uniref:Magnesium-transporting ATPase (P-type) n=3 Tax=Nocardiopsis composta TaxID=157465 RepID=A0A7W8QTF3_9ACTN|nr:magnesium-transporting ATPase (P-type) [Nocardiopsis composta]
MLHLTGTGAGGLDRREAERRLELYGPNELPPRRGRGPVLRFLAQFHNTLIYFLLAACAATWLVGHTADAVVILAVVLVNAVVGFVQEGRAEHALNAIRAMISPRAGVLRGGTRTSAPVSELVVGDLVVLSAGDRVPADLRLLDSSALLIDEAALTGESVAAEKAPDPVPPRTGAAERTCMAYSGTLVAAGRATGVVVATGAATRIGRIGAMLEGVQRITTPLLRQINRFGRLITWIAASAGALLFAFAMLARDFAWLDALLAVVALAVAFVPEGLPAVITITLAIGVRRMAARSALIRRLAAVEALGSTTVICSDKTGTLTRNEMTVRRLYLPGRDLLVEGTGYAPEGGFADAGAPGGGDRPRPPEPVVATVLLCNDAHLRDEDGEWHAEGDPMEAALVAMGVKAGGAPERLRSAHPRLSALPFDARHRYMATLDQWPGENRIHVKGAPERVLDLCTAQASPDGSAALPLDRGAWEERVASAAHRGERVIALARRTVPAETRELTPGALEDGLVLLGLVGLIDPPRPEAVAAIAECASAGIRVTMVTGDHAGTAAAVAGMLGLAESPVVVTGAELDAMDDAEFAAAADQAQVFARTSPEHKLRIVQALQAAEHVVAMTGDGVNDAPALKQADVGVAMGRRGTEAAKEAAEIVLLDDDFASIVAAVHEGRVVHDNIRKVIAWTLPTNGGLVLVAAAAIAAGLTMPMSPLQILWINLVTAGSLGLALAFEPAEDGVMDRPPRPAEKGLLSPFTLWRLGAVSVLFLAGAVAVLAYASGRGYGIETARTMAVNAIVVMQIFYLFNVRYLHTASMNWRAVRGTPALLAALAAVAAAQFAFTYLPFMQEVFGSAPVPFWDGVGIVCVGLLLLLLLEAEKAVLRRMGRFEELRV